MFSGASLFDQDLSCWQKKPGANTSNFCYGAIDCGQNNVCVQSPTPSSMPFSAGTPVPSSEPTDVPFSTPSSPPSSKPFSEGTQVPSSEPTDAPFSTPSSPPSSKPFLAGTSVPSSVPSRMPASETLAPSSSPLARPGACLDSPYKFKTMRPSDRKRIIGTCTWAAQKPSKRCEWKRVSSFCPLTCNACDKCVDAIGKFQFYMKPTHTYLSAKKCRWTQKAPTQRCNIDGMKFTCRSTCGNCPSLG